MELDFSDKIRQLGLQKSNSAEEIKAEMDMQTKKDNPEMISCICAFKILNIEAYQKIVMLES